MILIAFLLAGCNFYQPDEILIGHKIFISRVQFLILGHDFYPSATIFYVLDVFFISCTSFLFPTGNFYFSGVISSAGLQRL